MGRKEIAEAAGHSNRFLDRPVKAIDADTGIGADLTQLRRTVEELDPGRQGNLSTPAQDPRHHPVRQQARQLFQKYQSSQTHISKILGSLASGKDELLDGQRRDRRRAGEHVEDDGRLEQMIHISKTLGPAAGGKGERARRHRSRQGEGDP
jgi:uncharacterized protein YaaN involved in tellurite resistance